MIYQINEGAVKENYLYRNLDFLKREEIEVSDVVVTGRDGEVKACFVDSFGFTELPDFVRQRLQIMEPKEMQAAEKPELEDMDDGDEIIDLGEEKEQVLAEIKKFLAGDKETETAIQNIFSE